jgi:hypothetical protein
MPKHTDKEEQTREQRTHFTIIPNALIRGVGPYKVSPLARLLYAYIRSVTGEDGKCYQSISTLGQGPGIGRGHVPALKRELIAAGLIVVKPGKCPSRDTDVITVVDIWDANEALMNGETLIDWADLMPPDSGPKDPTGP